MASKRNDDEGGMMDYFPTELLENIFMNLSPSELAVVQQVCKRFKRIIDCYFRDENYWKRRLSSDYPDICHVVLRKCKPHMPYHNIYKSLTLWPRFNQVTEVQNSFACPTTAQGEVKGFILLKYNEMAVHTHGGIYYWNLRSLHPITRGPMYGNYLKYYESENIIVILGMSLNLFVQWPISPESVEYNEMRLSRVRTFLVHNRAMYIVFSDDEISFCQLYTSNYEMRTLQKMRDMVVALGFSNGHLNILTYRRNLYRLCNDEIVFQRALDLQCNMLELLRRYNFLENFDWMTFFRWVFLANPTICRGPLQDITLVKQYGDLFFVGTLWGIVRIYYKPYVNGELDIFSSRPLKEYNFLKTFRFSYPACPVLSIDVVEEHGCHRLYIAMPNGICVLNFHYNPPFLYGPLPMAEM
ncbi:hypothetical protein KGM_208383 [Danaus plexippus plexippus]|uniref:F-box domain-containing protein n=1 Tax=Danaus plexippus plexippus TaxID=278856 RepID=A0A212FKM9_DANPL|nr:hypothetical protein KGM_208383 [Danaus plexippus plexippus]